MKIATWLKQIAVTFSILGAYALLFITVIGAILFLIYGIASIWLSFYELL